MLHNNRLISRPYSKLTRLCQESAKRGGKLTTFAAVAKAPELDLSPGRITQLFGYAKEANGVIIKAETIGRLVAAFAGDGVPCEIDWFDFAYDDFAKCIADTPVVPSGGGRPPQGAIEPPSREWDLREGTVLADLVELRLHLPRPGNEVPNSYLVDATLLFGTAVVDYVPEEGEDSRSIAIALKNARLAIGSDSYQPFKGTMLGELGRESEHFERVAGGLEITGPKAADGTLKGDPLGERHLAVIAATQDVDTPFAVNVVAPSGSFVVADRSSPPAGHGHNEPDRGAVNRNAILNQFIYRRCTKDDLNRAIVARAELKRRGEDAGLS